MNNVLTWWQWWMHAPFAASAVVFGGAVISVVLYTYVHDYRKMGREG